MLVIETTGWLRERFPGAILLWRKDKERIMRPRTTPLAIVISLAGIVAFVAQPAYAQHINRASRDLVRASSNQKAVSQMFDGYPKTCWIAADDDPKPTLLVPLKKPCRINRVRLYQQYWYYVFHWKKKVTAKDLKEKGSLKRFRISVFDAGKKQWRVVDDHSKTPLPYDRRQLIHNQVESRFYEAAFEPVAASQVKIEFLESYEPPARVSHLMVLEAPNLPGYDNYPYPDWIFYYDEQILKELGIKCTLPDDWRDYNLNLNFKGMEEVREEVKRAIRAAGGPKKADYTKTKVQLLKYFRQRKLCRTILAHKPSETARKRYDFTNADKALQGLWQYEAFSVGKWWKYGGKGFQWDRIPDGWAKKSSRPYWFPFGPAFRDSDKHLSCAYYMSGDEKYAKALVEQLHEWIMAHPFASPYGRSRFHVAFKGRRPQARTGRWGYLMLYGIHSRHFTPGFLNLFLKTVVDHWRGRRIGKRIDWGCEEGYLTKAGYSLSVSVPFGELNCMPTVWQITHAAAKSFNLTGYPDGALRVNSTGYGLAAYWNLLNPWLLCRKADLATSPAFEGALIANLRWLTAITKPDGKLPLVGGHCSDDLSGPVRRAMDFFGAEDVLAEAAPWLLYLTSDRKKGHPPDFVSYPDADCYAGFYVMRSDWGPDARYLLMLAGHKGIEHVKRDKLHIALAAYGRTFLDGFWGEGQDSVFHNTVSADGRWQAAIPPTMPSQTMRPLKNLWVTSDIFDFVEGRFDTGYARGVTDPVHSGSRKTGGPKGLHRHA